MKKNRMMRLASVLLVCVLLTTSVISGTFAKYTSTATGTDTATVAKWSFKVASTDIAPAATTTFAVDLFSTAYELTNGAVGTDADADVKADGKIIAPGTGGSFKLNLENASDVTAKYTITLSSINAAGVPLEFSTDNGTTWVKAAEVTESNITVTGTLNIGATATDSAPIYWRWAFSTGNEGDTADTTLGTATALATPSVTVKVVAEQVD